MLPRKVISGPAKEPLTLEEAKLWCRITSAAEDGVVAPGEPVPNDNYRVEEGQRLLTYLVPSSAHVTVLTREGDPAGFGATAISVPELADLVAGKKPVELYEPLDSGIWARYRIDTVCALEQQYQP